jgi:hypothetical protein
MNIKILLLVAVMAIIGHVAGNETVESNLPEPSDVMSLDEMAASLFDESDEEDDDEEDENENEDENEDEGSMSDSIALEAWGAMTAATKVNKVKATPCTHHVQVEWKKGKYRWKACGVSHHGIGYVWGPWKKVQKKTTSCIVGPTVGVQFKLTTSKYAVRTCAPHVIKGDVEASEDPTSPTHHGGCTFGGKHYKARQHFTSSSCNRCTCYRSGSIGCVPLCGLSQVMCMPDTKQVTVQVKVPGTHCSCPQPKCVPSCAHIGCAPQNILCPPGEQKVVENVKVGKTHCTCPHAKCIKLPSGDTVSNAKPSEDATSPTHHVAPPHHGGCTHGGKHYKARQHFITSSCNRCTCYRSGGIGCVPLCGLSQVMCMPGTKQVTVQVKVPGTHCSCPKPKCVSTSGCEHIKCAPLPPIGCPPGEKKTRFHIKVGHGKCTCPMEHCVKVQHKG